MLIATVLECGSSAAERVSRFTHEREMQILDAKARPSSKVLAGMATLASQWKRLHAIVGGRPADTGAAPPGPTPETQSELGEWVRLITERLRFTLEVLDALAKRLDEPGFEPSRQSLDMAHEKLDQARDLVMAGPPTS